MNLLTCCTALSIPRQQLKIFETAMKLESRGFEGPFLPKDTNYRIDSSVMSTASKLMDPMAHVVENITRLVKSVVLSSLHLHPPYVVDMVVYPTPAASLLKFGFNTKHSSNLAVLVLSPEHYDQSGEHLVCIQAMGVTQLAIMGFKVMSVNMQMANKLMMHPSILREYLKKLYPDACRAKK